MRITITIVVLLFSLTVHAAERVLIPAGSFLMGCSSGDPDCAKDEGPAGGTQVMVGQFYIDKHEVSVVEFTACVEAGNCTEPKGYGQSKYCNYGEVSRNAHPVNCLDWSQAVAYCKSVGGRLPYEAEWEKAARAGSTTRYPWGQQVSCKEAIHDDGVTVGSVQNEKDGCGEDRTWRRGSRAANQYGLFDMHGNAGEWLHNWYTPNAITDLYAKGDLQGPATGKQRMVHGGSWDENSSNLRSSFRNVKPPEQGEGIYGSIGFRCAYDR